MSPSSQTLEHRTLLSVTKEEERVAETLNHLEERLLLGLPRLSQRLRSAKYRLGLSSTRMLEHSKELYDLSAKAEHLKKDLSRTISAAKEVMQELSQAIQAEQLSKKPKFRVAKILRSEKAKLINEFKQLTKDESVTDAELRRLLRLEDKLG